MHPTPSLAPKTPAGLRLAGLALLLLQCLNLLPAAPLPSATLTEKQVQARTLDLLARMSVREKIGQLTQVGADIPGPAGESTEELVRQGLAGSVLWTLDSQRIRHLQEIAAKESRLGIPLLFGFDVIHGYKTVFPIPLGLAATWSPELVERAQSIAALEASASGINWNFSPMVDIARDARWGRMVEGAGEDVFLGCAMARAQVRGIQGPALGAPGHLLACVKHFAGYGAAIGGRDYDSCLIPEAELRNTYLPPYKAAIDAGAGSVMSAYMCLNGVPATGDAGLLTGILRTEMGFTGLTISDSWSIASMVSHGYARDARHASLLAARAGVDIDMGSLSYLNNLESLLAEGKLSLADLDRMAGEVLAIKLRLGLFEHPIPDLSEKDRILNDPAHRQAAREIAGRSLVLLRNEGALLPLSKSLRSIALIGPLAASTEEIKGSWTAEGGAAVSVLEGLRAKLPGTSIELVRGGDLQRAYPLPWDARSGKKAPELLSREALQEEVKQAVAAAQRADQVILVLGERANMSGEAASNSTLALGGNQQELLAALIATGKPIVLVLLNGRPLDITHASTQVPAILEAWFPGTEGGNAIADVLFGDQNPGGKLPVSWPRNGGQCPVYYGHDHTQAREEDPAFTSRYQNESSAPLYPFGHGLSYTQFGYSELRLDRTVLHPEEHLQVSVTVTNTGPVAGDEVVQLYLHQRAGSLARPVRQLKGFQRLHLAPGASTRVSFTLGRAELEFWSPATRTWVVEPEHFDLWIGGDSKATTHAEFEITQ